MLEITTIVILGLLTALLYQYVRFQHVRRASAQDRQTLFQSAKSFHVVTFFRLRSGQRISDSARVFFQKATDKTGAKLVYAGEAGFTVDSRQLGERNWDGVLLIQFPSRIEFILSCHEQLTDAARETFQDSYTHGFQRNRVQGLLIPVLLFKRRLQNFLSGKWRINPLLSQPGFGSMPQYDKWRHRVNRLKALQKVNNQALVVFNLVTSGTPAQQAAEEAYNTEMHSRMAAHGYGPLHSGRAIAVGGNSRFDSVYVFHFPSPAYFSDLLSSQFFQGIVTNKPLGDTMSVPTVPITDQIQATAQ